LTLVLAAGVRSCPVQGFLPALGWVGCHRWLRLEYMGSCRSVWLSVVAREDVTLFSSSRIRAIPLWDDYRETLGKNPESCTLAYSAVNITEVLAGCGLNLVKPGAVRVQDVDKGLDFVRERSAATVSSFVQILSHFVDRYTTDPPTQRYWDGAVIRLFELQAFLELCALTRAFLINVRKVTEGYEECQTFESDFAFDQPLDFQAWARVVEGLFCFPTGKRTHRSFIHVVDHYHRAYSRRICLLQKGFEFLLDIHVTRRFRTEWRGTRDLDSHTRARLLHSNTLFQAKPPAKPAKAKPQAKPSH
jgi:hypothetical protein